MEFEKKLRNKIENIEKKEKDKIDKSKKKSSKSKKKPKQDIEKAITFDEIINFSYEDVYVKRQKNAEKKIKAAELKKLQAIEVKKAREEAKILNDAIDFLLAKKAAKARALEKANLARAKYPAIDYSMPDIPNLSPEEAKKTAIAYARYLKEHSLKPGDMTFLKDADLDIKNVTIKPDKHIQELAEEALRNMELIKQEELEALKLSKPKEKGTSKHKFTMEKLKIKSILLGEGSTIAWIVHSFGEFGVAIIEWYDKTQEQIEAWAKRSLYNMLKGLYQFSLNYVNSKNKITQAVLSMIVISCSLLIMLDYFTVYQYAYNGKVLGYVEKQETVANVLDIVGTQISRNNENQEISFTNGENITFRRVPSFQKQIDSADQAVNKLAFMTDIEIDAAGLYANNVLIAIVENDNLAQKLIDKTIQKRNKPDPGMEIVSTKCTDTISISKINVSLASVLPEETAQKILLDGGEYKIRHIVEVGEDLTTLCRNFGVNPPDIYDENDKTISPNIKAGDNVVIHKSASPLNVEVTEKGTMTEIIPFETEEREDDSVYIGDRAVGQEGVNGKQQISGTIVKINGKVQKRIVKKMTILEPAKPKIILIGTKPRPATAPTGNFKVPIKDYFFISSGFGSRWGRVHEGLDFAANTGATIYASDGGIVERAEWYSGYGLCIDIAHGQNTISRYAHCSSIFVHVGQEVYQGEAIGEVGNTGNSTGSHLHFEIRVDGIAIDPAPIINVTPPEFN